MCEYILLMKKKNMAVKIRMKSRKEIEKHTQKSLQLSMSFQKEDSAKEVIEFWRAQQQVPTIADSLDVNPLYRYWRDTIHKTGKVLKHSAIETIEFYSNMNPALRKWMMIWRQIGLL